ncbi:DUF998 domain-containing protein [Microbacterium resistens]|uniref:DUF998 domain-containing protein n=1 Tax=Microbacterium resistens TaxID=156977 RepID=A0ABY3RVR9_9MICO|nr:DUF998 domain-containing protein [Microbacterium resistens]UGS28172.1 DUF998 domain-containing protein [Microbacterium resistens]
MDEGITGLIERARGALAQLRGPARSSVARETLALLTGGAAFVVGFVVSYLLFWGHELAITGPWSIGWYAAAGGAFVVAAAFVLGRISVRPVERSADEPRDGFVVSGDHLRWYDLTAIAGAFAAIALLGWLGIAELLSMSFTDAPVFAFPGAILVAVAFALTAYVGFLGAAAMDPMTLSLVLAIFLVVGAFTAMLDATDPHWWRDNLSALGMASNESAPAFNLTLIIAGVLVTTIARYATAGLPAQEPVDRRGRFLVRGGLILMGILLALVGVFPVDRFFLLHNTVATGMAVVFAVVVVGLPWFLRGMPRVFVGLGWIYVLVIALLGVFFATGYYNLTAVELIAAVLIFSWIIVFLRTASTVRGQVPAPAGGREQAGRGGSRASATRRASPPGPPRG